MAEARTQVHTCELCGSSGFCEDDLRSHMQIVHVEGSPACPFCDCNNLTPSQLQVHVNTDHLDFLTPDFEDDGYLESGGPGFGSLWELEKCAENGITADGFELSPSSPRSCKKQMLNRNSKLLGNPFVDSDDGDDTEEDTTVRSVVEQPSKSDSTQHSLSSLGSHLSTPSSTDTSPQSSMDTSRQSSIDTSPLKRLKSDQLRRDKSLLSLPLRRPTGGCSSGSRPSSSSFSTAPSSPSVCSSRAPSSPSVSSIPSPPPLTCPMCPYTDTDPDKLQTHVNRQHLDELSPAIQGGNHPCPLCTTKFSTVSELETHFTSTHTDLSPQKPKARDSNGNNNTCPVCGETCWNSNQLQIHVESHFASPGPSKKAKDGVLSDLELAREIQQREIQKQKYVEEKEFNSLRAQYGMDNEGNFTQQSEAGMMKAVNKGELSVRDFYERKAVMAASVRTGVDDGSSVTPRITEVIYSLSTKSPGVKATLTSARVDHFASTYGDKGWGCGFRNLQMMMSCLLNRTQYREQLSEGLRGFNAILAGNKNQGPGNLNLNTAVGMPSIPRLQEILETAWRAGFDRAGCEQLGGKIVNTRKWIGATEIFTILSYCGIDAKIVDFHKPTGEEGTHPRLFEWVWKYYSQGTGLPPLYLQHQGHSRTICGIEKLSTGYRLLVLDPSHSPKNISETPLRMVRKTLNSMKSTQYQIVSVVGTITRKEREERRTKPISSHRIP